MNAVCVVGGFLMGTFISTKCQVRAGHEQSSHYHLHFRLFFDTREQQSLRRQQFDQTDA